MSSTRVESRRGKAIDICRTDPQILLSAVSPCLFTFCHRLPYVHYNYIAVSILPHASTNSLRFGLARPLLSNALVALGVPRLDSASVCTHKPFSMSASHSKPLLRFYGRRSTILFFSFAYSTNIVQTGIQKATVSVQSISSRTLPKHHQSKKYSKHHNTSWKWVLSISQL